MSRRKVVWIVLGIVVLLAAAGGAYYVFRVRPARLAQAAAAQTPTLATGAVTRGDLVISAGGSGTLVPAREMGVGFQSGGLLKEVLVELGDVVEAGRTLATLDDTDLRDAVTQAEIDLRLAQISLDDLTRTADPSEVAAAQAGLASAQAAYDKVAAGASASELASARASLASAQAAYNAAVNSASSDSELVSAAASLEKARIALQAAQSAYDKVAWRGDAGATSQAQELQSATLDYDTAKAAYEAVAATSKSDASSKIASAAASLQSARSNLADLQEKVSEADLASAAATLAQAQSNLDELLAGATASELEKARLSVQQARMSLESARRNLAQATLTAPISGTVTALTAQAGDTVGALSSTSSAIITLSDLAQPRLQFWVEETDMASMVPGNPVNIVFEALPDYTFSGEILSVEPALVTESNTTAVKALASIDLSPHPFKVLSGMNAEVEVVAGEARNTLLVPIEALRELATDQYAVFVIQPDGQQVLRPVQVGLKDLVNAEILSGVEEGETVSLGTSQRTAASLESGQNQQFPPGGGMMFFEVGPGGGGSGGRP